MMVANALVVMTKLPVPGQSKTRLVPPLTYEDAAALARALLLDQLVNLAPFTDAQLSLAFAPDDARDAVRALAPPEFELFPQRGDDLGARMTNAFEHLFALGCKRVVLIGGDLPVLPREIFTQAFEHLDGDSVHVVFGPSVDGGYYLVGMNRPLPAIFHGIIWSRPNVLQRTCERLFALQIPYKFLPDWYDIDTIEDLRRLALEAVPPISDTMKNTSILLRQFRQKGVL